MLQRRLPLMYYYSDSGLCTTSLESIVLFVAIVQVLDMKMARSQ